jgi:hypothetical protein
VFQSPSIGPSWTGRQASRPTAHQKRSPGGQPTEGFGKTPRGLGGGRLETVRARPLQCTSRCVYARNSIQTTLGLSPPIPGPGRFGGTGSGWGGEDPTGTVTFLPTTVGERTEPSVGEPRDGGTERGRPHRNRYRTADNSRCRRVARDAGPNLVGTLPTYLCGCGYEPNATPARCAETLT